MRPARAIPSLLLALLLPGAAAQAQQVADGRYSCALDGRDVGQIEISGDRYRTGGDWAGLRRIGPAIMWSGRLGPISDLGEVIGTSVGDVGGRAGFVVQIKARGTGEFLLVGCRG